MTAGTPTSDVSKQRASLSLDDKFAALSDAERRRVLLALLNDGGWVEAVPPGDSTRATALYHAHLPKLADWGLVEFRPETGEVRRGPRFEDVETLLQLLLDYRGRDAT